MTALFTRGDYSLASNQRSSFKIECDALTDEDWATLAAIGVALLPGPFGAVEGVPTGGLRFAYALEAYVTEGPLLIADDVWTTGGSIHKYQQTHHAYAKRWMALVAFARGPLEWWATAVFAMPKRVR